MPQSPRKSPRKAKKTDKKNVNNIYLNTVGNSNGNHFPDLELDKKNQDILKNVIVVGTKVDL